MDIRRKLIDTRREYIDEVRAELLGPGSEISIPDAEHEVISGRPDVRYSIGILFPQNNKMNADNDDESKLEDNTQEMDVEEIEQAISEDVHSNSSKSNLDSEKELVDADEDNLDEEIGLASQNMPSSMGITFFVKGACSNIICKVSFGTYKNIRASQCLLPAPKHVPSDYSVPSALDSLLKYDSTQRTFSLPRPVQKKEFRHLFENGHIDGFEYWLLQDVAYKLCDQLRKGYVRTPHKADVELNFGESDYIDQNKEIDGTTAKLTAMRRKIDDDIYSITVMLVNDAVDKPNGINCIFQPEIKISTADNHFSFYDYSTVATRQFQDDEERMLAMQYRKKKVYGTGLGTAINWDIDANGKGYIFTDFFPQTEVPPMTFELPQEYNVDRSTLSMKMLSDLSDYGKDEILERLSKFVSAYEQWIGKQVAISQTPEISNHYHDIAERTIADCLTSLSRMQNGIKKLTDNENAWTSFLLANRAMFMQREQLRMQAEQSNFERFPDDQEVADRLNDTDFAGAPDMHFWRPFQLAFLLMSISAITDDNEATRDLVDLIWFPTGGGKTEAYLGLTAFTIFYRRLAHRDLSSGTTVIMRYTLRLLAAQQFTRAATLICACEIIRQECTPKKKRGKKKSTLNLGDERISIGLWIGGEHTPNRNDKAKELLRKLTASRVSDLRNNKEKYNKFQVLKCPWCGTKLVREVNKGKLEGQWGYMMRNNAHFYMACPQEACPFNNELPVQIVDEELYLSPPTLLFGTVDKFAMLPWKKEIGSFFAEERPTRTPELIIQDELHLISGPLGTMVGLYETVIDALCSAKGVRPKIVASTATIRRAKEQCAALYNRAVSQFPSPGLNSDDSFFAKEATISHENGVFGRLYVGLMPSGKTKAMMEVRTIAALMQEIYTMDLSDELKDKLWTLTVYFNSLKDLGKCSTLIDDDVKDFIRRKANRLGTYHDARIVGRADELTSRVSTTELNETLDKLEKLCYSKENIENKRYASGALLATNMISVGIDIDRLNVMLLVGQPKLTSEYIQASSRVGRKYPGVAFTLYDGSKSRDRSHYEQFKAYHESFYRHVEPTGATPFSKPARDRALHAVIVAFLRHYVPLISDEKSAGLFNREELESEIEFIKQYIIKRNHDIVQRIDATLSDDSAEIEAEIDAFLDEWQLLASTGEEEPLQYGESFMFHPPKDTQRRLLKSYNSDKRDITAKDTMTSMRNVDTTVAGNVLIWEE